MTGFEIGRLCVYWWSNRRLWDWSFHSTPCCWVFIELGPLQIQVCR